jgi:TatD DNase family protein
MKEEGVATITIGTDKAESERALTLARTNDRAWCAIGQHPVDNKEEVFDYVWYKEKGVNPKVVAVGECGLDYFRLSEEDNQDSSAGADAEVDRQKTLFEEHIKLALELDKPLMIHGRPSKGTMDAYEDILDMLENAKSVYGKIPRANFHFFVGDITIAKRVVALGMTMSFSGVITFAKEFEEVIREVPLTHMHVETDSPYATPVPFRGERNTPLHVKEVITKIAEIKQLSFEEVRAQLLKNAERVFAVSLI